MANIKLFCKCSDKTVQFICNTTILLRRELRSPSYLFFEVSEFLKKVFQTPLNDFIWLAERSRHLIFKEAENKCYIKLYKTIKESISSNVADRFYSKGTQRALGHSKSTRRHSSGTLRALQLHSRH